MMRRWILPLLLVSACGAAPSPGEDPARTSFERARALLAAGDRAGASAELDRWMRFDPKYALVRADLGFLILDEAASARRRSEEEGAARLDEAAGSRLSAFRHMAIAYALAPEGEEEGRLGAELVRLAVACPLRPTFPPALAGFLGQAQILAQDRRHLEAAAAYRQAARFCPWCAQAHYNEALLLGEYQRYPQALSAMRRAAALLPEGPERQEAEGMIATWELLAP